MPIRDYSHYSERYLITPTSDLPVIGQSTKADDYQLLVEAAQRAQGDEDDSLLMRWLARFGIKRGKEVEVAALPTKFNHLREQEFDRANFDYQAYLASLEKGT